MIQNFRIDECLISSNNTLYNKTIQRCFLAADNSSQKIIHFIITRFLLDIIDFKPDFPQNKIYDIEYVKNGIKLMKKYLIPSLEYQSCKNFIWIIMVGDRVNLKNIIPLLNIKTSFQKMVIHRNYIKKYIKKASKNFDVLITTGIDYDDRIYYDAVNDVRKTININKPILLHGYHSGFHFYEDNNKYYKFYINYNNNDAMSIFYSLIIFLKKVNNIYIVYDLGIHNNIRKKLINSSLSFGIEKLNYEPAVFDDGDAKFVWVRQNYSSTLKFSNGIKKDLTLINFNLSNFYGF